MRSILTDGVLCESTGEEGTRATHGAGVYFTPRLHHTACGNYSTPQDVFDNNEFHKVVVWLRVDTFAPGFRFVTDFGQVEWLAPNNAIQIAGLLFFPNCGARYQETRLLRSYPDQEP